MIKFLGILLLSTSISIYGTFLSRKTKYIQEIRDDIYHLLKAIERDIKYGCIPLSRIIFSFKPKTQCVSDFIKEISQGKNVFDVTDENLSLLDVSEREKIKVFFSATGKSTCSEKELILCKNCLDFFEDNNAKTKKDTDTTAVLYRKLGYLCSILTFIILI